MFACCRIRKSTAFVFKHYLKSSILTWRLFVVSQSAQCFTVCRLGNAPSPMAVPISGQIRFQAPKSNILMFSSLKHMPDPCSKRSFSLYMRNLVIVNTWLLGTKKYLYTRVKKEKFRIFKRPCNVLFIYNLERNLFLM